MGLCDLATANAPSIGNLLWLVNWLDIDYFQMQSGKIFDDVMQGIKQTNFEKLMNPPNIKLHH
jgi:hypothetical protein